MKKFLKKFFLSIMLAVVTLCSVTMASCKWRTRDYETTDIADYGNFVSHYADNEEEDKKIEKYMCAVLPEKLEDYFTIVAYLYKVDDGFSGYPWYEGYLEVMIEDEGQFQSYIAGLTEGLQGEPFYYDSAFTEYVLKDGIHLQESHSDGNYISYARIQKTLINDQTNTIIFTALMTPRPGSFVRFEEVQFFERFNIGAEDYYGGDEDKLIIYKQV